jgi:hypothetical protein
MIFQCPDSVRSAGTVLAASTELKSTTKISGSLLPGSLQGSLADAHDSLASYEDTPAISVALLLQVPHFELFKKIENCLRMRA